MKTIILAAFAALSLGVGMAQAQTLATGAATRTAFHQTIPTASAFDAGWGNG
jgi:ABC-type proline/glycine betaine transport system permease subunit